MNSPTPLRNRNTHIVSGIWELNLHELKKKTLGRGISLNHNYNLNPKINTLTTTGVPIGVILLWSPCIGIGRPHWGDSHSQPSLGAGSHFTRNKFRSMSCKGEVMVRYDCECRPSYLPPLQLIGQDRVVSCIGQESCVKDTI